MSNDIATITIISCGKGHAAPPAAIHIADVSHLFRDPHIDPAMRQMNGRDQAVIDSVMRQPGAARYVMDLVRMMSTLSVACVTDEPLVLVVMCVGGRHRSVVIAERIAAILAAYRAPVTVVHRDIDKPVIARPVAERPSALSVFDNRNQH